MGTFGINIQMQLEKEFWLKKLEGVRGHTFCKSFPKDKTKEKGARNRKEVKMPSFLVAKLNQVARNEPAGKFVLLLSTFKIVCFKYASNEDFLISSSSFNLENKDPQRRENLVFFRLPLNEESSVLELIDCFQREVYRIDGYSLISHETLQESLNKLNLGEAEALLQVGFYYEPINRRIDAFDQFELVLGVREEGEDVFLNIYYQDEVEDWFINQFAYHFFNMLEQVLASSSSLLSNLTICTDAEVNEILFTFNTPSSLNITDLTIQEKFEKRVIERPDSDAVVCGTQVMTFRQLNQKVNQLAHYLRQNFDINPNTLIGVQMRHSELLPVALLGVIKAGAGFLPIPIDCPEERLEYIWQDSNINLIISDLDQQLLPTFNGSVLNLSTLLPELMTSKDNPENINSSNDLAYVIYTSGSTGKPKGVLIQHDSLCNYVNWFKSTFEITHTDRSLLFSSIAYDLSYTSLWGCLLTGACLNILKNSSDLNLNDLISELKHYPVTFLKLTPSHLSLLLGSSNFEKDVQSFSLRMLVIGGEALKVGDVKKYLKSSSRCEIVNHYGPTETTIGTIYKRITIESLEDDKERTVIGSPIKNNKVLILNKALQPVPKGVLGEICVLGEGLGRGYLNRPELTNEKFLNCSYYNRNERMYLTGDLGRWTVNGEIEFFGRKDDQVKVRGHRVEIGEIETVLQECEWIKNVVVIPRSSGENINLVAYLTTERNMGEDVLRTYLKKVLPDFMHPAFIIFLDKLPLTQNGKVDRKRLPDLSDFSKRRVLAPPSNELEKQLVNMWKDILRIEDVGIFCNFFELGGNSLSAIRVINQLHNKTGISMELKVFLQNPTIESLAKQIDLVSWLNSSNSESESGDVSKKIVI